MSDEVYEVEYDVRRYQCQHIPLPDPPHQVLAGSDEAPVGEPQHMPPVDHALQAPPTLNPGPAPVPATTGFEAPAVDVIERYQTPAINAEYYQAPPIDPEHCQAPPVDAGHYQAPPTDDFEHYLHTLPARDIEHHHHAPPTIDSEHCHYQQAPAMDIEQPQMLAPEQAFGFPEPPLQVAAGVDYDALPSENYQAPLTADVEHYQEPPTIGFEHHQRGPAMDIEPPQMLAPEQVFGFPESPLMEPAGVDFDDLPSGNYQAPPTADVEHYRAPPTIDVEHYQQAPAMDIEPLQMVPPEQSFVFPESPLLAADEFDFDTLPSFDEGMLHEAPAGTGSPLLYDQSLVNDEQDEVATFTEGIEASNDTGGAAVAEVEPDVRPPIDEDNLIFVPFVPGQLDCTDCCTVRELLHESANHKLFLMVHGADHGPVFHHAIIDRTYICADGETKTNELTYLDLRQRTHHWVQCFIASWLQVLRDDTSGQLKDSWSAFSAAAAGTNNIGTTFPVNNAAHMELEIDMLKKILSEPSANDKEAAAPLAPEASHQAITPQGVEISQNNQNDWHGIDVPILDSSNLDAEDGSPGEHASLLAVQRKRIANMTMADATCLFHLSRKEAAKHLKISPSSLKRLCNRNGAGHRWPARRINGINTKIKKLEEAAARNGGRIGMMAIREKLGKLKLERAQLYASTMKSIRENEMNKGAGSSGSKKL